MLLTPLAGTLADRTGPWRWFAPALVLLGVTAWPLISFLVTAPSIPHLATDLIVVMVLLSLIQGTTAQLGASFFPIWVRSSGLGLSVNLGVALFGGLAPLIITQLIATTGNKLIPGYYIAVAMAISLVLLVAGRFGRAAMAAVRQQEEVA
jgi:MHS family proline/betaine transporter-like MFS transporter